MVSSTPVEGEGNEEVQGGVTRHGKKNKGVFFQSNFTDTTHTSLPYSFVFTVPS